MYAQKLVADDLQYLKSEYKAVTAYARTKRMQVVLAGEWAKRGQARLQRATRAGSTRPGIADSLPAFKTLDAPDPAHPGAGRGHVRVAAPARGRAAGRFWHDRAARPEHYTRLTRESRGRPPRALERRGG